MHTLSLSTIQDLAYERGEEFDPALFASPALIEDLALVGGAGSIVEAPSKYERRRRYERERRRALASVPEWLEAQDLGALEAVTGEVV